MKLEVCLAGERRIAGTARDSTEKLADMRSSLRRLDETVDARLFEPCRKHRWRLELRYPERPEWTEFVEKPTCGGIDADRELIETALVRTDGLIVLTEDNLASLFRKASISDG